jgi:hypothetical protein
VSQRVGDILKQRAQESFTGRTAEKTALLRILTEDRPLVLFVHGIAGIGKSSLLEAFSTEARSFGATVIKLDCRATEPTERGFFQELGAAIGSDAVTADEIAGRLGKMGKRVVLTLDTYEVFRMMDSWLRRVFIPALPDNVRVVLCGREAPVYAWLVSPEWAGLFQSIPLGPLREDDALALLASVGVKGEHARRLNNLAHGHPLALRLASSALTERLAADLEQAAIHRVIEELTRLYLSDVPDPLTRKALEAASVLRCVTQSLLKAMLPAAAPQDAFERLRALSFVESGREGLILHEAVREAIAASLKAADPNAYRDYRRAAWRQLRVEIQSASREELWRYTADMLYIIDNPLVREAYFPSGVHRFAVETARPEDGAAVQAIIDQSDGPEAARLLKEWWARAPQTFAVARDPQGSVAGFQCLFDPSTLNPALLRDDPVFRSYYDHMRQNPLPANARVMFGRRALSLGIGEGVSPSQGACWHDCKRKWIVLRPNLRRAYGVSAGFLHYPGLHKLGFRSFGELKLDGTVYYLTVLDLGPGSVDGWLAGMVAAELGVEEGGILDIDARELVLNGRRATLTPMEFGVMNYLYQHQGKAVSRASLIENVWGYSYDGGSNVIDTVVLSLRKKLAERASVIEAVRGVGYRLRGE